MLNWSHESPLDVSGNYKISITCRTLSQQTTSTAKKLGTVSLYTQNNLGVIILLTSFDLISGDNMDNLWFI